MFLRVSRRGVGFSVGPAPADASTNPPKAGAAQTRGASPRTVLEPAWQSSEDVTSDDGLDPCEAAALELDRIVALLAREPAGVSQAALRTLHAFDVSEHLDLQRRVLQAERSLLDAQLEADARATENVDAVAAALDAAGEEVTPEAEVALRLAQLGVVDAAAARLQSLRAKQRGAADGVAADLVTQRVALRSRLNTLAPGLDPAPVRPVQIAPATALEPSRRRARSEGTSGGMAALLTAQLPGLLLGLLGALLATRAKQGGSLEARMALARQEAAEVWDLRAAAAAELAARPVAPVDPAALGYSAVEVQAGNAIFASGV